MKLFTCGELKQLTFNAYDYNCTVGLKNAKFEPGDKYPTVDESLEYKLHKNTKEGRKQKGSEPRGAITRISSKAKILKIENVKDFKAAGLTMDKETGEIVLQEGASRALAIEKIDGVYITKSMVKELNEAGYKAEEHLKVFNPENVSRSDEKHKSGMRAFRMTDEIKKVRDDINRNYKKYEAARQEGQRLKSINRVSYHRDGSIYYGGRDVTVTVDSIEKYVDYLYQQGMKKGGPLEGSGILKPVFDRRYGNCSANYSNKVIKVDPLKVIDIYASIKDNKYVDPKIRNSIDLMTVTQAVYYHEVGHIVNNSRMDSMRISREANDIVKNDKKLPVELYKKAISNRMELESTASAYALNLLEENGLKGDKYEAAKYALSSALHTYNRSYKNNLFKRSGDTVCLWERAFKLE